MPAGGTAVLEVLLFSGAGTRIPLKIEVRSLLRQDSTSFPSVKGFAGEILVVSAGSRSVSSAHAPSRAVLGTDLTRRARSFRRPGLAVDRLDFEAQGAEVSAVRRRVIVPDPAAPAETPVP